MNGNPQVIAVMQEGLNLEASLAHAYFLNGTALKEGLGIKTGTELMELGEQCCHYKEKLLKRLLLLGASPEIAPDTATLANSVAETLQELLMLEESLLTHYTTAVKVCYDAADMEAFHFFQHLCKDHTIGQHKRRGHIKYLEHERIQFAALGEVNYIAAHI